MNFSILYTIGLVAASYPKGNPKPIDADVVTATGSALSSNLTISSLQFANTLSIDFSTMADGAKLPRSLQASDNERIGTEQLYMASNVFIKGGLLQLRVPGGQTKMPYLGAEVATAVQNIKHASVVTRAKFSPIPGTCHGLFFYKSDNAEIDIEYLTAMPKIIHYTNQKATARSKQTYSPVTQRVDLTADFHDYRIDWVAGQTTFYLDGVLQNTFTSNVPTVGGSWLWNNWFNGDPEWSGTGPQTDSFLQIQKIMMKYDT